MRLADPIRRILPRRLADALDLALDKAGSGRLQSLRIRRDKPLSVTIDGTERFPTDTGELRREPLRPLVPTAAEVEDILVAASQGSYYAVESELRRGYLTLPGGHRLGVAGEAVTGPDGIESLKHITSVHLRFAHEVIGCADKVLPHIVSPGAVRPWHTLVVGPPGSGKTTLLRDVVRQLSLGTPQAGGRGFQVAVADERSEIAGCYQGQAQLDVGPRTDVIDGAPKAAAIAMLIRSMSPEVVVTDEIGAPEDAAAVADLLRCGVTLIASAHGTSFEDLSRRPMFKPLLEARAFQCVIELSGRRGVGTVERVVDPRRATGAVAATAYARGRAG